MIPFFMKNTFFIISVFFSLNLGAQSLVFDQKFKELHSLLIEMKFSEFKTKAWQLKKTRPEDLNLDYLLAAEIYLRAFVIDNPGFLDSKLDSTSKYIKRLESLPDSEPFKEIYIGQLYLAQAVLEGRYENYFNAAWNFLKSYNHLSDGYSDFPEFAPNGMELGVLYASLGSLPDDFKTTAKIFGFNADIQQGMKMISNSYYKVSESEEYSYLKDYYGFVFSFMDFQLNDRSDNSPEKLGLNWESSSFMVFMQSRMDYKDGKAQLAVKRVQNRPKGKEYADYNYLDYYLGKIAVSTDYELSKKSLNSFIASRTNDDYLKSSLRYLAWSELLAGNSKETELLRTRILSEGKTDKGADLQALREAERGFNIVLIRARILFDAGQYKEALVYLESNKLEDCCAFSHEKLEYYYRLGRCQESLNLNMEALISFKRAVNIDLVSPTFALGNSLLKAGDMERYFGNSKGAEFYYKACLDVKSYPFYDGIHQKAKAGLSALK